MRIRFKGITLLLIGIFSLPTAVFAQGFPGALNPGAILQQEQFNFMMNRQMPFLRGVMTEEDVKGKDPETLAPIEMAPGVIPGQQSIQGILTLPDGKVIITSPD